MTKTKPDSFLPYGRQTVEADDIAAVTAVLQSDYLTTGPTVGAFEEKFCQATGAKHAVACSSGTAALHLAALALDLQPNDVVIVPSMTFLATANAARYVGAEVCFADVDPDTGLMTTETLLSAIERARTLGTLRAIFVVHLNGAVSDLKGLSEIAKINDCLLVEDACHALGTDGVGACEYSTMACFSFHPVKAIAAGEGGAIATNDAQLRQSLERLRNHGMVRDADQFEQTSMALDKNGQANPWYYEMPEVGFNYRLSDIHAALVQNQLRKLDQFVAKRRKLAAVYDELLSALENMVCPVGYKQGPLPAWHLYAVLIDFAKVGKTRAQVMQELRSAGIGTQVHYIPVHLQPYYLKLYGVQELPGADQYYERVLSLPLFPSLTEGDIAYIVSKLCAVLADG